MNTASFIPVLIQLIIAAGFAGFAIIASSLLGPKRKNFVKEENWECGIEQVGNARIPVSVKYFMVAILFVLFDVEIIFFYPYAVNFKEMGWEGFLAIICFIVFFMLGFIYIWKKGALDWEK